MNWLSEDAEILAGDIERQRAEFDAIVVGSGYGGAVIAARLAQQGLSVCVLERGKEYSAGEFPNDMAHLPGHVRIQRAGIDGLTGLEEALFDFRVGRGAAVLVGNALGGGSQINANVVIEPDQRVFESPRWPIAIRSHPESLPFDQVKRELGVARYPNDDLARPKALGQLDVPHGVCGKADLAVTFEPRESIRGVRHEPCNGCGNCVTGCNYHAKNTLTKNYLPLAKHHGARIFTGVNVLAIDPRERRHANRTGAVVYWRYSSSRRNVNVKDELRIEADAVILAAGTLGSVEILQRSRDRGYVAVSDMLGERFSTNGDWIAFAVEQRDPVHAIGWRASSTPPAGIRSGGPTITATIDARAAPELKDGVIYQDAGIPGALAHGVHELWTTASLPIQLTEPRFRGDERARDPLGLREETLTHTQTYLGMGHDDSPGRLIYEHDRTVLDWPAEATAELGKRHDAALAGVAALDGLYVQNPLSNPVPEGFGKVLAGAPLTGPALSVHPLGGCVMADSVAAGVVDDHGAVFDAAEPGRVFAGLYVADGSIVPTSLGANPLLTIAALAERAAPLIAAEFYASRARKRPTTQALSPEPDVTPYAGEHAPEPGLAVVLSERMSGTLETATGDRVDAALLLNKIRIEDVVGLIGGDRVHRIEQIEGWLSLEAGQAREDWEIEPTASSIELLAIDIHDTLRGRLAALATWLYVRGGDEIVRGRRANPSGAWWGRIGERLGMIRSTWRLAGHAGETRRMRYRLELKKAGRPPARLEGRKDIRYSVDLSSWQSVKLLACGLWLVFLNPERWAALDKRKQLGAPVPNIWRALGTLDATIAGVRATPLKGKLEFDITYVVDHLPAILSAYRNLPTSFAELASLGMFFARVIFKQHLWSFWLPDYGPTVPQHELVPGAHRKHPDPSHTPRSTLPAPKYFRVAVHADRDDKTPIDVLLTRFEKSGAEPVVLLPGFAQSTAVYLLETTAENLVEQLWKRGFDVWLLDTRTSTALPCAHRAYTFDQVAEFDIPTAVDRVLKETGTQQVKVFAHCMGSVALAMSLLSGKLEGKVAAAVLSQCPPFLIGGRYTQFRRELAAFLRDVVGLSSMQVAADERASGLASWMDRLLTAFPLPDAERCKHDGKEIEHDLVNAYPDIATCHRVTGVFGRLYNHANINAATHRMLDRCFGIGSLEAFAHISKFFDYERIVSADGDDRYVTDYNIREHLCLPIMLLHGTDNVAFDPESARRSLEQLERVNPPVNGRSLYEHFPVEGHAHFDCIVGTDAHRKVFPRVGEFLTAPVPVAAPRNETEGDELARSAVRPLRAGPIVGWVRAAEDGKRIARIWGYIDEYFSPKRASVVAIRYENGAAIEAMEWDPIVVETGSPQRGDIAPIFVADVEVPADQALHWVVMVVHRMRRPPGGIDPEDNRTPFDLKLATIRVGAQLLDADIDLPRVRSAVDRDARALAGDLDDECTINAGGKPYDLELAKKLEKKLEESIRKAQHAVDQVRHYPLSRQTRRAAKRRVSIVDLDGALIDKLVATTARPLRIAVASCRQPGTGLDRARSDTAFKTLAGLDRRPDLLLLTGDQVYVDATGGVFDTLTRLERIGQRYRRAFTSRGFADLVRTTPTIMCMDDHEIVDNWSQDDLVDPAARELHRTAVHQFIVNQWVHGPRYDTRAAAEPRRGLWHAFEAAGYGFFVLDARTGRSRRERRLLDDAQFDALTVWLEAQQEKKGSRPKLVICGSVLAPPFEAPQREGASAWGADNWQEFPNEIERLLRTLLSRGIENVVFVSGDYHCAAAATITFARDGAPTAYSVVATSTYSPYPFANARPEELSARGRLAEIRVDGAPVEARYEAKVAGGDGYGMLTVEPGNTDGSWSISFDAYDALGNRRGRLLEIGENTDVVATLAVDRSAHSVEPVGAGAN